MDRWRYFAITHRDHVICNPTSLAKLDELIGLLDLRPGARVLDVACGKAEFLARMVERCAGSGVGVDASPQFAAAARDRLRQRGLARAVLLHEQDGADYDGRTALHLAASEGREETVQYLPQQGAKPDPVDRWGNTPLEDARRAGHSMAADRLQAARRKEDAA